MAGEELVSPWHWWRSLGSPRYVSAPMVNNSELAFRLLVRRHGVQLTYTPMIPAKKFISMGAKDRLALIEPHEDDRPLIVQFCSDEPDELLEAGRLARDHCDAIDLNLGCPQSQAARDHYGAVLMEEPELVSRMVRRASQGLRVPVTCKIRVFDNLERTVAFAKMLQASGCSMLTVHGRTRGCTHHEGSCNWDYIREVKEAVDIPVIANGGMIRSLRDVRRCLEHTGADAVMSAIGLLLDPRLFGGQESGQSSDPPDPQPLPDPIELALEYLELAKTIPSTPGKSMREHVQALLRFELCPSYYHRGGKTDRHKDLWNLVCCNRVTTAHQCIQIVEVLAWREKHRLAPYEPPPTLKQIKYAPRIGASTAGPQVQAAASEASDSARRSLDSEDEGSWELAASIFDNLE